MDLERLRKEASDFVHEGDGYIHSEMKGGKAPKLLMAGDTLAVLWQVVGIINRVCEISGTTWAETCGLIFNYPSMNYRQVKNLTKDCEKKVYVGNDWNEQWKKEQTEKIQREASLENIGLALNLKSMEERNASLNELPPPILSEMVSTIPCSIVRHVHSATTPLGKTLRHT